MISRHQQGASEIYLFISYTLVLDLPSSKMTTSPKILTSTPPFSMSTSRVKISRIALLRALTSIAHTPKTTVGCFSEGEGRPGELARCLSRSKLRNREVEGDLGGGIAILLSCLLLCTGARVQSDKSNVKITRIFRINQLIFLGHFLDFCHSTQYAIERSKGSFIQAIRGSTSIR